jgi:hypothetical protein
MKTLYKQQIDVINRHTKVQILYHVISTVPELLGDQPSICLLHILAMYSERS